MTKGRVALIIPYFGPLPQWFPYFAKSAANSQILDVLLFTDARDLPKLPDNIKAHCCTLAEFSVLASDSLSLAVSLKSPFKVCDFRPTFGIIFNEYIRDYEFWAFGDIDLVFGDLGRFLEPLLVDNDVISFRKGWVSGSFCVLRNCGQVNSIYKSSSDWQKSLLLPDNQLFDELGGFLYREVLRGSDVLSLKPNVDSFTHVVMRAVKKGSLRCAFNDLACENLAWGETITFESGRLIRSKDQRELMYIHFVCMKRRFFEAPRVTEAPDSFAIRKTGIYLQRPGMGIICSQEFARVIRGGIHGIGRLLHCSFTK